MLKETRTVKNSYINNYIQSIDFSYNLLEESTKKLPVTGSVVYNATELLKIILS